MHTLGGERTNITFYNDVRVPDSCRVGEVDGGWNVMHVALVFERNSANCGRASTTSWSHVARVGARRPTPTASGPFDDPAVRRRAGPGDPPTSRSARCCGYRAHLTDGTGPAAAGRGLDGQALRHRGASCGPASSLLDAPGIDGAARRRRRAGRPGGGWIEHGFRHSVVTTIYAGASEIQRGIIAEGRLGLPSTPRG